MALVRVKMHVPLAMVFVLVRVNIGLERPPQSPNANTKKHDAHNPITKRRNQIYRQRAP